MNDNDRLFFRMLRLIYRKYSLKNVLKELKIELNILKLKTEHAAYIYLSTRYLTKRPYSLVQLIHSRNMGWTGATIQKDHFNDFCYDYNIAYLAKQDLNTYSNAYRWMFSHYTNMLGYAEQIDTDLELIANYLQLILIEIT